MEREPRHPITQPVVLEAFDRVGAACRAHGIAMGTAVDPGESMRVVEKGVRYGLTVVTISPPLSTLIVMPEMPPTKS